MLIVLMSLMYAAFVDLGLFSGGLQLHAKYHRKRDWWRKLYQPLPVLTLSVFAVTLIFTVLQFAFPTLYFTFQRDAGALAAGDWWRLFTPLLVQDGGVAGAFFNLMNVLLVGAIAEKLMRRRSWLIFYFGTGLIAELLAYGLTHTTGAGNSLAYFGLITGILVAGVASKDKRTKYVSLAGLFVGVILVLVNDIHGIAFVVGGIMASLIMLWPKHFHGRR